MSYPEDVPFEIVREQWNSYDLGKDVVLKTKLVLMKISKPVDLPIEEAKQMGFQAHPHFVVYTPVELKGTPEMRRITPKLMTEAIIEDIDPVPIGAETVNEYSVGKGFIRLRLILVRVSRTSLYGADGTPVYTIQHNVVPQIHMPRRRRTSRRSKSVV